MHLQLLTCQLAAAARSRAHNPFTEPPRHTSDSQLPTMAFTRSASLALALLAALACAHVTSAVPVPTFPKAYSAQVKIVSNVDGPQSAQTMAYWQRSAELNRACV